MTAPIPKLPTELARYQDVVDGLLAKKPEDRIQTSKEAIKLLEGLQD